MNSESMGAVPTIKCEEGSPRGAGAGEASGCASYNLSVNMNLSAAVSSLLAAESAATTPRTPEILNSLIAMTSPLEQYTYSDKITTSTFKGGSGNDSNSSISNGSSATSPANGTTPSIQKTCSELIKAGLKLSIQSKRKTSESDSDICVKRFKREDSDDDYDSSHTSATKGEGLTPEDEERRRRRRERNKIAATKCRMKKRERTVNLVTESEVLESQNIDLKSQLKDLEVQRRQLIDMLSLHTASCVKNNTTTESPSTPYNMIRPYESPTTFPASYEASSPYLRPESANILASSYTCVTPLNGDSSIDTITSLDNAYMPPQILDAEYNRPESVLSLQSVSENNYGTTDGFLPKATHLLVIESGESEYYEQEINYSGADSQQCHLYSGAVSAQDHQSKINSVLNDTCLV